jgi:hypothetical protein
MDVNFENGGSNIASIKKRIAEDQKDAAEEGNLFVTPKKICNNLPLNLLHSSVYKSFSYLVGQSVPGTALGDSEPVSPFLPNYQEYLNNDFFKYDYNLEWEKSMLIRRVIRENINLQSHANDKLYLYETLQPSINGIQAIYMGFLHATSYTGNEHPLHEENESLQCLVGRIFATLSSNRHALWKLSFFSCFTIDEIKNIWKTNIENSNIIQQELKLVYEFNHI